jgi:hypothetical protein
MEKKPQFHYVAINKLALVKGILDLSNLIDASHIPVSTQLFDEFHELNPFVNQSRSSHK